MPADKPISFEVKIPLSGYPRSMYFNRFRVERLKEHRLIFFGLMGDSGLIDHYTCFISGGVLDQNKKILKDWLERIGSSALAPAWNMIIPPGRTDVIDVITMAHGVDAEIAFGSFAFGPALKSRKEHKGTFDAQPLILLRSDIDLQASLIAELYAE